MLYSVASISFSTFFFAFYKSEETEKIVVEEG